MTRRNMKYQIHAMLALTVLALSVVIGAHELRGQAADPGEPGAPGAPGNPGEQVVADKAMRAVFATVPVYVDTGATPLAAYQFELTEKQGRMKVVGIANGEHAAFDEAPYYDAKALSEGKADRVVVAAFSLNRKDNLPAGQTRVATVQVMLTGPGEPDYQLKLITAGDVEGKPIANATISMTRNEDQ